MIESQADDYQLCQPATSLLTELLVLYFPPEVVLPQLLETLALVWQWLPSQSAVLGLVSVELLGEMLSSNVFINPSLNLAYSVFSSSAL